MRWSDSLIRQQPNTGRMIKEDGSSVNIADLLSDSTSDSSISDETAATIYSGSNGKTVRTVTSVGMPVMSIRAKTADVLIVPLEIDIFASGNAYYEIIINATLTGDSFASAGSNVGTEIDVSATASTGGTRIASGFVVMAGGIMKLVGRENLMGRLGLEYDTTTNIGDIITISVIPFAGSVSASASLQWRKIV